MTQQQKDDIARALAIYRGLPDDERQDRLESVRRAKHYRTDIRGNAIAPDIRTFAIVLLPHLEKAEADIRTERADFVRAEVARQVREMSGRTNPEALASASGWYIRVAGCVAATGFAGYGAYLLIKIVVESGILLWVFVGLMALVFLSALQGSTGSGDKPQKETEPTAQNIHINITGHGGQIHVTQN